MSTRSFTLIELLIVISIISLLSGLAVVGVISAIEKGRENRTQILIENLKAALEAFEAAEGEYPPSSLMNWQYTSNGLNDGIEAAVVLVRTQLNGGPHWDVSENQDAIANLDSDSAPDVCMDYDVAGNQEAFEIIDPWGNPLVYVAQVDGGYQGAWSYNAADGTTVTVQPMPMATTDTYPPNYMIWSFGPNGENENGRGDDITSWKKSDADYEPPFGG